MVTGLCTNFQKSSVVPIRCANVDLEYVLHGLPVVPTSFPMRYLGLPLSVRRLKRGDFQYLEDKCAGKIPPWQGRYITTIGRGTLVKSVLSSQAIYSLTPLIVHPAVLQNINKLERAFLWAGTDKVSGGQCKVNWEAVCRPTHLGGLGILHLDKFARALRLRWPWLQWNDSNKIWAGSGNPCTSEDMDLFYASTLITVGNGKKTSFWDAPWVNGLKPRNIAPLIFKISSRKKWCIHDALLNNAWFHKIKMNEEFSIQHLHQFVNLWVQIHDFQLDNDLEDTITWTTSANGVYSAKSAYRAQFLGTIHTDMNRLVWKVWAPPKTKFFAWLALQNRVWTADRLARRGRPNCGLCPLCKRAPETIAHLLVQCRFTARLWGMIKTWLGLHTIDASGWANLSTLEWWRHMTMGGIPQRKAMASLTLLVSWEIWNERNGRVFRNKYVSPPSIYAKIKYEANLWVLAGARHLGVLLPGE